MVWATIPRGRRKVTVEQGLLEALFGADSGRSGSISQPRGSKRDFESGVAFGDLIDPLVGEAGEEVDRDERGQEPTTRERQHQAAETIWLYRCLPKRERRMVTQHDCRAGRSRRAMSSRPHQSAPTPRKSATVAGAEGSTTTPSGRIIAYAPSSIVSTGPRRRRASGS